MDALQEPEILQNEYARMVFDYIENTTKTENRPTYYPELCHELEEEIPRPWINKYLSLLQREGLIESSWSEIVRSQVSKKTGKIIGKTIKLRIKIFRPAYHD